MMFIFHAVSALAKSLYQDYDMMGNAIGGSNIMASDGSSLVDIIAGQLEGGETPFNTSLKSSLNTEKKHKKNSRSKKSSESKEDDSDENGKKKSDDDSNDD